MGKYVDRFAWCKDIINRRHHTVISGCSGSGKSVAIHDIIYTAMLNGVNDNLFVFIDTKKVELVDFKDSPHCARYCDDPDEVYAVLKGCERVMDSRFSRMQARHEKMSSEPTLWIVIDEFYDIKTLCDKRCMTVINRLSSAGRAAKVILLVGTQRTTRDTLSGMIATNFSVKLGLRTITAQDSRNIIQTKGCEDLPKCGKGILQIDGINKEIDIPFVDDRRISERVDYWNRFYSEPERRRK